MKRGYTLKLTEAIIVVTMVIVLTLFPMFSTDIHAKDSFETPAVLSAGELVPPQLLKGEYHEVQEEVRNDGYLNLYQISSDFGEFEAHGTAMLTIRVKEIQALAELAQVSKTEVFLESAKEAGLSQVDTLVKVAENPVETAKGIPGGVGRMFKRTKRKTEEAIEAVKETTTKDEQDSGSSEGAKEAAKDLTERYFGISGAERRWSEKLGTDPYTSNETLAKAIEGVAQVDQLGSLAVKFAPIPSIPGVNYVGKVSELVWSKDPSELKDFNHQRLVAIGANEALIQAFLDVPWYSPTLQTAFITSLSELEGVSDRATLLEQALDMQSEVEARFFVQNVMLLSWFHQTQAALDRLLPPETRLPLALTADKRVISLLSVDYLFWTEGIAAAARSYVDAHADLQVVGREFWFAGKTSERCRNELEALGWTVRDEINDLIK